MWPNCVFRWFIYIYYSLCDRNDVVVFFLRNSIWTSFKNDFDIFSISDWIWNEESLTIIKMMSINYIHSYTVRLPPSPSPLMVTWFGTRPKYTHTPISTHILRTLTDAPIIIYILTLYARYRATVWLMFAIKALLRFNVEADDGKLSLAKLKNKHELKMCMRFGACRIV